MVEAIVVMGVSGCGKSSIGKALADALGWNFMDADSLHPKENVEKMRKGIPLTDADRFPWLTLVNQYCTENPRTVTSCSALRLRYREILRTGIKCKFVFLQVSRDVLEKRVAFRPGHFMPASLLDSQLNTLEKPTNEPDTLTVNCDDMRVEEIVQQAAKWYISSNV